MNTFPNYINIPPQQLGGDSNTTVSIYKDAKSLAQQMAEEMLAQITQAKQQNKNATLIVPVGPVDQFPILAQLINEQRVDCRNAAFINMDEYLTDDDKWLSKDHPLSFRGFMDRLFYNLLDSDLAPKPELRVFPDPDKPDLIGQFIDERGGADVCFGGIGINGHVAFNEPPEPDENIDIDTFAALPTRKLTLSRETRTINSVTVGGEISIIPHRAVTVGMKEILASKKLRFYCNRPWQSAVIRRVLHGPITAACPASFLRTHRDASVTITEEVARVPNIQLR